MLGTEGFEVRIFNAGYALESLVLKADGMDDAGRVQFSVELSAECLPRGKEIKLEVPSYAIAEPARDLSVSLVSAEYGS